MKPLAVRNAELEAGSDAHYVDPRYYSATYADRRDDIAYYLGLAAALPKRSRRVLEYGCGNGRIAVPMARAGARVTGLDRSKAMLADFRKRLAEQPKIARRVAIVRGDMRATALEATFPLVMCTFNTFLHLYTRRDVERFCQRVRDHLTPRGRFVVDISIPDPEELSRHPQRAYRTPRFKHPSTGEVVRYAERFDYNPLSQVLIVGMEFEPRGRPDKSWITPLAHRQFFPAEMEALLHYNGLEVTDIHGDFVHLPPKEGAESLIYHCRKR